MAVADPAVLLPLAEEGVAHVQKGVAVGRDPVELFVRHSLAEEIAGLLKVLKQVCAHGFQAAVLGDLGACVGLSVKLPDLLARRRTMSGVTSPCRSSSFMAESRGSWRILTAYSTSSPGP